MGQGRLWNRTMSPRNIQYRGEKKKSVGANYIMNYDITFLNLVQEFAFQNHRAQKSLTARGKINLKLYI